MLLQIHLRLTQFFIYVVFAAGRYDLKVRSLWGILLARFGPMFRRNSLIFCTIDFASFILILWTIRCLGNFSMLISFYQLFLSWFSLCFACFFKQFDFISIIIFFRLFFNFLDCFVCFVSLVFFWSNFQIFSMISIFVAAVF